MAESLDAEKVRKVAVLARLKLSDAEIGDYTNKLGSILKYVDTLNEVDTEGVEPMVFSTSRPLP